MLCSDTPFLIEKHVSRTEIRCGGYDSHSDTPFREKKPVSRACGRRKRLMRCCRDKGKDSEKGNRAAIHLFASKNPYREHGEGKKDRCDAAIHHFGPRTLYREHRKREKYRCCAATHHF